MSNNTAYVSAAKPKVGGSVFVAPLGTQLPTDATTALANTFKNLGYISDEGVKKNMGVESSEKKAWGGDTVLNTQEGFSMKYSITFIEHLNEDVQKVIHGSGNVTGTLSAGRTIKTKAIEYVDMVWVIEKILRNGVLERTVIPSACISEIGEITEVDNDTIAYPVTLSAHPNANEDYEITYQKEPTQSQTT